MERLIINNKQKYKPYETMLEVLAEYLNSKYSGR